MIFRDFFSSKLYRDFQKLMWEIYPLTPSKCEDETFMGTKEEVWMLGANYAVFSASDQLDRVYYALVYGNSHKEWENLDDWEEKHVGTSPTIEGLLPILAADAAKREAEALVYSPL